MIPQYREDADHQQHNHQRIRHKNSARINAVGNEQIERYGKYGRVEGDYPFGDQVQENAANHPEHSGQELWYPEMFTPKDEVGERGHKLQDGRFYDPVWRDRFEVPGQPQLVEPSR